MKSNELTRRLFLRCTAAAPLIPFTTALASPSASDEQSTAASVGDACTSLIGLFDDFYYILMEASLVKLGQSLRQTEGPISQVLGMVGELGSSPAWAGGSPLAPSAASREEIDNLRQTQASLTAIHSVSSHLADSLSAGPNEIQIGDSRDFIVYVRDQAYLVQVLFDQVMRGLIATRQAVERMNVRPDFVEAMPEAKTDAGYRFIETKLVQWGPMRLLQDNLAAVQKNWNSISTVLDGDPAGNTVGQREKFIAAVSRLNGWTGSSLPPEYRTELAALIKPVSQLSSISGVDKARFDATADLIKNLYQGAMPSELASTSLDMLPLSVSPDQVRQAIKNHCGDSTYIPSNLQVRLVMFAHRIAQFLPNERRLFALTSAILWIQPNIRMVPKRIRSVAGKIAAEVLAATTD